jgi:YD repeat-containing protein
MHGYLPDQTVRDARSYEDAVARHVWKVPPRYAIADDLCDRHADGRGRPALLWERQGRTETWTFDDLHRLSSQLAAGLRALGLGAGDRAALMLPQTPEHALAHVAVFRLGAVSLPLSRLFGSDALRYRLGDSEARVPPSTTRAAPTTSSTARASGSARRRSRARCSSTRPWSSARWWGCPTPSAARP